MTKSENILKAEEILASIPKDLEEVDSSVALLALGQAQAQVYAMLAIAEAIQATVRVDSK